MASSYPTSIDSFAANRTDATAMATTHKNDHNDHADAINKIEAELGTSPSGTYATVASRLNALGGGTGAAPVYTVNVKDTSLPNGGAKGDGTTDDRAAIQAAINSLPARGGVVYFPCANYRIVASGGVGLDLSGKTSVVLVGEGGMAFNEGSSQGGTYLTCGSSSMTLLKYDGGSSIQQLGPQIRGLNFADAGNSNCVLAYMKMVNHWSFYECTFVCGGAGSIGTKQEIPAATYPSGDNNWSMYLHCRWDIRGAGGYGIHAHDAGVYLQTCTFNCNSGIPGVYAIGNGAVYATNSYWVGGSDTDPLVYIENGYCVFTGCIFENNGGGGTVIEVVRPGGAQPPQGRYNKFIGCNFVGNPYDVGINFGSGCDNNQVIACIFTGSTNDWVNSGQYNVKFDFNDAQIVPWSGGKLCFFGHAQVSRQTSVPVSAAGIHAALVAYGLIT